jgi:hypothetical protein
MKIVIGRADLDEEGFRTCVSKVMFMLNNRPIQQSGSIQDQAPLTPNSFVLGDLANAVFPPDFAEVTNLNRKLKQQIKIQKAIWKRFFLKFVPLLGPRQKWFQEQDNLKVHEVVIELDENQPRGVWRLMRVSKIFPSHDGLVRKVEVTSTHNKTYIRLIAELIRLSGINYVYPKVKFNFILCMCDSNIRTFCLCMQPCIVNFNFLILNMRNQTYA